jgi:anaerobic selenocysteine-containing dehydrogenase
MTTHHTACILCSRNCGIEVDVEERRLVKIRGDAAHPISEGYLCQKAARLDFYQNNEDRLTHPLRRRPDGSFERVSWEEAVSAIARRLLEIRREHGGKAFAFYGGGGQGNHLGGAYGTGMLRAMKSPFLYSSLAQEKTGDFWVNGKLFGRQTCHTTEDVEHADFVLFIGTNPWQAHGIRNARDAVRALGKSDTRKMAVIDPRRTETAELADVHLQLRPGTDAFLLLAMLAILVRDSLVDEAFIRERTVGYDQLKERLLHVPIRDFIARADVPAENVERVIHEFANARSACVRVDLGLQQSLHSTLNSYLEKLLFLLTGNLGKEGSNNFHSFFLPLVSHSGEGPNNPRTTLSQMPAIGHLYPPNILPAEIDNDHPQRVRALFVDSANPMMSGADTQAYARAMKRLELLVVVDVAMTETAKEAHYVLPAASQFEKWEATGFTLDFPKNGFHLRAPLMPAVGECLPEAEIYTRILRAMGELPKRFPILEKVARLDRRAPRLGLMTGALALTALLRPKRMAYGAHVLYQTLGKALPEGAAATAPLWFSAHMYARRHRAAVSRAGHRGGGPLGLGESLWSSILGSRSGMLLSEHRFEDTWSFIRHEDKRVHLAIPEMLEAIDRLSTDEEAAADPRSFVLIAGERRAYNANTIYRDPTWRKQDPEGALSMHPDDADRLGLADGDRAICRSSRGAIEVTIKRSSALRTGLVTLPHGYGMSYRGSAPVGPRLNELTDSAHRDAIAATPFHKNVRVQIEPLAPGS